MILSHIDGDATKAEELDDGVLNAGISYYLSAQKSYAKSPRKWKYSGLLLTSKISCIVFWLVCICFDPV